MLQLKYLVVLAFVLWGASSQTIVTRAQWGAKSAKSVTTLKTPVPYIVIHHSATGTCSTQTACSNIMKTIQNYHMTTKGWSDIGYNFAAGGDGKIYEARGWTKVGAHAPNYNNRSIGIVLIGDFTSVVPPAAQLIAVNQLIATGVNKTGVIDRYYKLVGHRQVNSTECPGNALYNFIKTNWPNWTDNPSVANEVLPESLLRSLGNAEQVDEEIGSA